MNKTHGSSLILKGLLPHSRHNLEVLAYQLNDQKISHKNLKAECPGFYTRKSVIYFNYTWKLRYYNLLQLSHHTIYKYNIHWGNSIEYFLPLRNQKPFEELFGKLNVDYISIGSYD